MKIAIPTLAAAISLAVFACSESPSAPPAEDSSSSGEAVSSSSEGTSSSSSSRIPSSSSSLPDITGGRACQYSGEEIGVSGLFVCAEAQEEPPDWQEHKTQCQEDGGTWAIACPSDEKATCVDEEDEDDILYKIYADGIACADLELKNADGSEDIVSESGVCGPFKPAEDVPFSMCVEFPELSTFIVRRSCVRLQAPFANECPRGAYIVCKDPETGMISHLYGFAVLDLTCEDLGMEELQEAFSTFP